MVRVRKNQKKFLEFYAQKSTACDLCTVKENEVVQETRNFYVANNAHPYNWWDFRVVADHKLIIPKRHVTSLLNYTEEEKAEYIGILSKYEADGYNFYGRSLSSGGRSENHQHTHLIKLGRRSGKRFLLYLRKPYLFIFK